MIIKCLFSILIISTVLVRTSWAKPALDSSEDNTALEKSHDLCHIKANYEWEPSQEDNSLSPSNQLLKFTLIALKDLSVHYVEQAKNISELLLKNDDLLSSQSAKILEFKKNLTEFQESYNICDNVQDLFELVELYSNTTSDYFELNETSLATDDKLILKLLEKYDSKNLDEEALKMLNRFVESFDEKFQDLKEDLIKEEGQVGKNMIKWFDNFKTLTDFDDKIDAFEQFFILFEESDTSSFL